MKIATIPAHTLAVLAGISLITPALATVNINYVTVGDAGNANDTMGYGAVNYAYKIAQNETTISEYADFLNAVASTDTYGLYNSLMTTSTINGISQSGSAGSYIYTVNQGSGNKPITYVSWFDAARFTNWLHNGQPSGLQNASTTEDGAYTLNGAMSGIIAKNSGANAWIPTESEWYKAAYYDPNKNGPGMGGYWLHANQSDTMTTNSIGAAGAANYYDGDHVGYPGPALTDVGAYGTNSDSAYRTNDQAGNVWEWNDSVVSGTSQRVRGGSWDDAMTTLRATDSDALAPTEGGTFLGFRVASRVPEPSSLLLTMLASSVMLIRRKR